MKRLLALGSVAAFSLVGCSVVDSERPAEGTSNSPAAAESTASATADDNAGDSQFVDVSPGGPKEEDPLWQSLAGSADSGDPIYLWAWMQTEDEPGDGDSVTLSPSTQDSVKVTAPKSTVDANGTFALITGTFTVEEKSDGDYALTAKSSEAKDDLIPDGPTSEERCTAENAQDTIGGAADKLAQDSGAREGLRKEWLSSPEVWWAIQDASRNLRDSGGDFEGDSLATACGDYVEAG